MPTSSSAMFQPKSFTITTQKYFANVALLSGNFVVEATPSIVTGTSTGPKKAWYVKVTYFATNSLAPSIVSLCITGTNPGTLAAGSYAQNQSAVCNSTPANMLAGVYIMAISGFTEQGLATYTAVYANNTTISFACEEKTNTANVTSGGYCDVEADPI